jgi:drug/metabolite transporter (DMT)-like permease
MPAQLIALLTAISYASCLVSARRGLAYTTPITLAYTSAAVQTVTLWTGVFLTSGIPEVALTPVLLFVIAGILQLGVRLFSFTGIQKIGASQSSALQSTNPLISAFLAITILQEEATAAVLMGTALVVFGIVLICWRREGRASTYRRWHVLLPLGAAILTGVNHPMRRYALSISNQPLFFAAVMGIVSFICVAGYVVFSITTRRLVWHRKAILSVLAAGLFETMGILLITTALSVGPVVVVAPIAVTYPLWVLLGTVIFSRDLEQVNARTSIATICVVIGTTTIYLAG